MSELEAATKVLTRAVELDNNQRYKEALVCYQEGTNLLMVALKNETDKSKKQSLRLKLEEYLSRGEKIKPLVLSQSKTEKYHEKIEIKDGERGYCYKKIFGNCLTGNVTEVRVEDPYVRTNHQILNFVRFCEMLVHISSIKKVKLLTGHHQDRPMQEDKLNKLAESLKQCGLVLEVSFSDTLHDREITFDNGWVVKIGRGLDFFKPVKDSFSVGYFDHSLRACHETTVDLYKNN